MNLPLDGIVPRTSISSLVRLIKRLFSLIWSSLNDFGKVITPLWVFQLIITCDGETLCLLAIDSTSSSSIRCALLPPNGEYASNKIP